MSSTATLTPEPTSALERSHSRPIPRRASSGFTIVPALIISALLGFAAFTKFAYANPKQLAFDYATGTIEVLMVIALLSFRRRWPMWALLTVFFAGMTGWSLFKSLHGEACGCFAAFWEPPKFFTVAMNSVIIAASLAVMARLGATLPIITGVLSISVAAGGTGFVISDAATPPKRAETAQKHGGKLASQRLLESTLLADVVAQPADGPTWMIFAYDPTCHICEGIKPFIQFKTDELSSAADPIMQIKSINIVESEKTTGIEQFAWETPTIFLVQQGVIVKSWAGKVLEGWSDTNLQEIYDQLASGKFQPDPPPASAPAIPSK